MKKNNKYCFGEGIGKMAICEFRYNTVLNDQCFYIVAHRGSEAVRIKVTPEFLIASGAINMEVISKILDTATVNKTYEPITP